MTRSNARYLSVSLWLILSSAVALSAQSAFMGPAVGNPLPVPENTEIRRRMADLLMAPIGGAREAEPELFDREYGTGRVRFDVREERGSLYYLFLNENDFTFPVYGSGSYIMKRNLGDGRYVQVKIFLRGDPGSYVRLYPQGERSRMDLYLYDSPIYRDVLLPVPFVQLLTEPFASLVRLTSGKIDWSLVFPDTGDGGYRDVQGMVERLRTRLPDLGDSDDGAMDADGAFVYIDSLDPQALQSGFNCSGFAKWVADGIYQPVTGRLLSISELKRKPLETRGNGWSSRKEEERDPYFGLDWSRNIASALREMEGFPPGVESADVREVPFFDYIEDVGYPIEHLRVIMHSLAVREPGFFYIGSVNREFGSAPVLRQHVHVAVFFPYFEDGNFRMVVMERNRETLPEAFIGRYRADYVHLVRVKTTQGFTPPKIE